MRPTIRYVTFDDTPDEFDLAELGYGLTGAFREPRDGERYVAYNQTGEVKLLTRNGFLFDTRVHGPDRHIVERIPLDPPSPEPVSALVEVETTRTIRVLGLELDEATARKLFRELEEVL